MTALSTMARQERKTRRYPPNLTPLSPRCRTNTGKHADDHCGCHSWGAADPDGRGHHSHHVSPQAQAQETGEGADREEVREHAV